jgi:hypothetical protein
VADRSRAATLVVEHEHRDNKLTAGDLPRTAASEQPQWNPGF